jgi:hypothetical protein
MPDRLKEKVSSRAAELVDTYLKPTHIKPPLKNEG